jgi:hypothetical protein
VNLFLFLMYIAGTIDYHVITGERYEDQHVWLESILEFDISNDNGDLGLSGDLRLRQRKKPSSDPSSN